MLKYDFSKVAKHTSAWVFFCKFAAYFGTPFTKNTSERLLLQGIKCFIRSSLASFSKSKRPI